MKCQAGAANARPLHRYRRAAALFGELRKSNRRRVRLDPASQLEQSWIVRGHALFYGTTVQALLGRRRASEAVGHGHGDNVDPAASVGVRLDWVVVVSSGEPSPQLNT